MRSIPALTWLFNVNGTFPIKRGELDLAAIDHALNLVKEGHVLGMFPEGTRSRTGKLQRGRSGAARIAIQAQVPVVPAYVHGVGPVFKPSNYLSLKPRAPVTVRIGPPLPPPEDVNDSRALRNFTRQIMACHRRTGSRAGGAGRSAAPAEPALRARTRTAEGRQSRDG